MSAEKRDERRYYFGGPRALVAAYRRDIGPAHDRYMHQFVLRLPGHSWRLHHILRSDNERDLHDHPFSFFTLLLTGSYLEILPDSGGVGTVPVHRRRFSLRFVPAERPHRLVLTRPVWTLVLAGPRSRPWGFFVGGLTRKHWVDHEAYDNANLEKRT